MNFSGGLFCWEKQSQKIRPKNSGPKFGRPKFVSQNSAPNSGSGGAKSPVQKFVPDKFSRISRKWSDSPFFSTVWQFSRIPKFSRKWTFLKRPLFQKTPFSEPDPQQPGQPPPRASQNLRSPNWGLFLSFLSLVVLFLPRKTPQMYQGFSFRDECIKPWKNKRKHPFLPGNSLLKSTKESQIIKESKDRVFLS